MRPILLFAAVLSLLVTPAAAQYSNAAQWLIDEQIAEACDGHPGRIDPAAAIERDLTGDGNADFLLSHEGITCAETAPWTRSAFCGMQVCTVRFYVRRGQLLELAHEMLGGGLRVDQDGPVPRVHLHAHGGAVGSLRWDGESFR